MHLTVQTTTRVVVVVLVVVVVVVVVVARHAGGSYTGVGVHYNQIPKKGGKELKKLSAAR